MVCHSSTDSWVANFDHSVAFRGRGDNTISGDFAHPADSVKISRAVTFVPALQRGQGLLMAQQRGQGGFAHRADLC